MSQDLVVTLAARNVSQRLRDLLPFHKSSLLAVERAAADEARNTVYAATTPLESYRASRRSLRAAHLAAVRTGMRHAVAEFELLGIEAPVSVKQPSLAFLNQVAADLRRSLLDKDLSQGTKAHRAALAASVVANRAYSDGQRAMYAAAVAADDSIELHKVWVTNKNAMTPPCRFCLRLDGQSAPLGAEFKAPSGLKVYADLQGPPCHPQCRCRVVARVVRKNKSRDNRSDG